MKAELGLIPWIIRCKLYRSLGKPKVMPINLTVSVTNTCNSRCKTCSIWKLYRKNPELEEREFKTDEFEKTFESIGGSIIWATVSGGEPYLRPDLVEICKSLIKHCSPSVITIPTNAILSNVIEDKTKKILEHCDNVNLIVNLSLDGVGSKHDEIRGVQGNFSNFLETYERLKNLQPDFSNLNIGVHSVVSKFNIDSLFDVYEFVKKLEPDSFITEVAEERAELFTLGSDITPDPDKYSKFVNELSFRIRKDHFKYRKLVPRIIQAFRLSYYRIAAQVLKEQRQAIPCYAGYASCQLTPYGDVWPCCVLGYDKPMGNLRENNYDFKKVWFSQKAHEVRKFIKSEDCACPLANASYTNMLLQMPTLLRVLKDAIF